MKNRDWIGEVYEDGRWGRSVRFPGGQEHSIKLVAEDDARVFRVAPEGFDWGSAMVAPKAPTPPTPYSTVVIKGFSSVVRGIVTEVKREHKTWIAVEVPPVEIPGEIERNGVMHDSVVYHPPYTSERIFFRFPRKAVSYICDGIQISELEEGVRKFQADNNHPGRDPEKAAPLPQPRHGMTFEFEFGPKLRRRLLLDDREPNFGPSLSPYYTGPVFKLPYDKSLEAHIANPHCSGWSVDGNIQYADEASRLGHLRLEHQSVLVSGRLTRAVYDETGNRIWGLE